MYGKYWEETKAWKICENEGCGKLLPTYDDMQKHMFYHCKNNDGDPFINKSNEGKIDRRTMRGFGLPSEDMFMFKGKVMYGKIRKKSGYVLYVALKETSMGGIKYLGMLHQNMDTNQELKIIDGIYPKMNNIKKLKKRLGLKILICTWRKK